MRIGPGIEMGERVGVAPADRLANEVERHVGPVYVALRVKAGLRQRDLEGMLGRAGHVVGHDRLALEPF